MLKDAAIGLDIFLYFLVALDRQSYILNFFCFQV